MLKKLLFAGIGLSFVGSPLLAYAQVTITPVHSVSELMEQISGLQAQVNQLNAQATVSNGVTQSAQNMPAVPAPVSCIDLPYNLGLGSRNHQYKGGAGGENWYISHNADVSALQQFLSVSITGYFGVKTQAAVKVWQAAHGIDPIGSVGPKTRAAMGCQPTIPTPAKVTFDAKPNSGQAPLSVSFTADFSARGDVVDFGDGNTGQLAQGTDCNAQSCGGAVFLPSVNHTYQSAGTYTAKLQEGGGCGSAPACLASVAPKTLAAVKITVSAPSVDPILCPLGQHSDGTTCVTSSQADGVKVISASLSKMSNSVGWSAGDSVTVHGSGFTSTGNEIYTTDGAHDTYLLTATSSNGTDITFVLPSGFNAPFGTGIKVKNTNGSDTSLHLSAGQSVTF